MDTKELFDVFNESDDDSGASDVDVGPVADQDADMDVGPVADPDADMQDDLVTSKRQRSPSPAPEKRLRKDAGLETMGKDAIVLDSFEEDLQREVKPAGLDT
ncbi:hypothetical protein EV180_004445, partial [Coemansia sp. RSA 518]